MQFGFGAPVNGPLSGPRDLARIVSEGEAIGYDYCAIGDQVMIPMWADRFFVGWVFRLITQPRTLLPRLWNARRLPGMMLRYGKELPAARPRAARGHRTQVTGNRTEDTGHRTQDRDRGQK